jgi:hypothetical protein
MQILLENPEASDHVPAAQFRQVVIEVDPVTVAQVPGTHRVHWESHDDPVLEFHVPAGQGEQLVTPSTLDHVPAVHIRHWLPELAPLTVE